VVLSQTTAEGDQFPGVALYVPQTCEIAYRPLLFAQKIEMGPYQFSRDWADEGLRHWGTTQEPLENSH
jgi:hypothetical protein